MAKLTEVELQAWVLAATETVASLKSLVKLISLAKGDAAREAIVRGEEALKKVQELWARIAGNVKGVESKTRTLKKAQQELEELLAKMKGAGTESAGKSPSLSDPDVIKLKLWLMDANILLRQSPETWTRGRLSQAFTLENKLRRLLEIDRPDLSSFPEAATTLLTLTKATIVAEEAVSKAEAAEEEERKRRAAANLVRGDDYVAPTGWDHGDARETGEEAIDRLKALLPDPSRREAWGPEEYERRLAEARQNLLSVKDYRTYEWQRARLELENLIASPPADFGPLKNKLHEALFLPEDQRSDLTRFDRVLQQIDVVLPPEYREQAKEAISWLANMVSKEVGGGRDFPVNVEFQPGLSRAFMTSTNTGAGANYKIVLGGAGPRDRFTSTVVHEMGHAIEGMISDYEKPDVPTGRSISKTITDMFEELLDAGEKWQLVEKRDPRASHGVTGLNHPYAGRVYFNSFDAPRKQDDIFKDGRAINGTEATSMGLEVLYDNPALMLREYRVHTATVLNFIRHSR